VTFRIIFNLKHTLQTTLSLSLSFSFLTVDSMTLSSFGLTVDKLAPVIARLTSRTVTTEHLIHQSTRVNAS